MASKEPLRTAFPVVKLIVSNEFLMFIDPSTTTAPFNDASDNITNPFPVGLLSVNVSAISAELLASKEPLRTAFPVVKLFVSNEFLIFIVPSTTTAPFKDASDNITNPFPVGLLSVTVSAISTILLASKEPLIIVFPVVKELLLIEPVVVRESPVTAPVTSNVPPIAALDVTDKPTPLVLLSVNVSAISAVLLASKEPVRTVAPVTANEDASVAASFTYNLLFKEASPPNNRALLNETSPFTNNLLFNEASPPNNRALLNKTSPFTNNLLFKEASPPNNRALLNETSSFTNNLLFKEASPPNNKALLKETSPFTNKRLFIEISFVKLTFPDPVPTPPIIAVGGMLLDW